MSKWPERQISSHDGRRRRRELLVQLKAWSEKLLSTLVHEVEDLLDLETIGFLLDTLSDPDEACGWVCVEDRGVGGRLDLYVTDIELDRDVVDALAEKYGKERVVRCLEWVTSWLLTSGVPFSWICWRLGRIRVQGRRASRFLVEVDHVLYDLHAYPALRGICLLDGPSHTDSTLLKMPSWREAG